MCSKKITAVYNIHYILESQLRCFRQYSVDVACYDSMHRADRVCMLCVQSQGCSDAVQCSVGQGCPDALGLLHIWFWINFWLLCIAVSKAFVAPGFSYTARYRVERPTVRRSCILILESTWYISTAYITIRLLCFIENKSNYISSGKRMVTSLIISLFKQQREAVL